MNPERRLAATSVAIMLASVHYGIGFILGTGEKAFSLGAAGSLYAVCCALGLVALSCLAGFYWRRREPLWNLLGDRYGRRVRRPVIFLSWAWMTGIVASQLLGGAFIAGTMGLSPTLALFLLALIVMLISLLPVERASLLFQVLIIGSSLALLYALTLVGGLQEYAKTALDFLPALTPVGWGEIMGISLATVLITVLGMDFHQFVVRARTVSGARWGCLLAGSVLLLLAFLPSSVVIGGTEQGILPASIDGKQAVPGVLWWVGQHTGPGVGSILVLSILIAAIGSGAGVLRIMNRTFLDALDLTESARRNWVVAIGNASLVLLVALTGRILINLIVSFYTIYISGVLLPLIVFIWEERGRKIVPPLSVYLAMILGGGASIALLTCSRLIDRPLLFGSNELTVLSVGLAFSSLGLLLGKVAQGKRTVRPT